MGVLVYIVALVVLFALSAIFSSSETVLFSLSPLQVRNLSERTPVVGNRIAEWQKDPSGALSTILAGNTLVNFAIGSLGYLALSRIFPNNAGWLSVPLFTILLLVFGEIFPKQYALRRAEALAPVCARTLAFWTPVLRPVSFMMVASSSVFRNVLHRERRALSDDEFKAVVEGAADSGVLDQDEASMVKGVMRLPDLYALNEMTPRVRLTGLPSELTIEEMSARAANSSHRFLPVFVGNMDHIEGFFDRVKGRIDRPLVVGEHDGLDDILVTFVRTGRRIALVKDRWGGTAGIITRGDILELIVGGVGRNAS